MGQRMRPHRLTFTLAALYNAAFGCWAALFPEAFFNLLELAPPRYPSLWGCIGMIVGLYGILYAAVAREPERGDLIVWIGLAGKVLGPIGWLLAVRSGELPPRTFPLILANDLVWWFPFLSYLLRRLPQRGTIIAWAAASVHVIACAGLLATRGGNEATAEMALRASWIAENVPAWVSTWGVWTVSSLSLLAFMVAWAQRILAAGGNRPAVVAGCVLCAVGLPFDVAGELVNIVWLTSDGLGVEQFAAGARAYVILGPGIANGLYCAAGLVLSGASRQARFLRGGIAWLGLAMWMTGLALTAAAILDHRQGMVMTGGAVMILFLPWAVWMGWRLRPDSGQRGAP